MDILELIDDKDQTIAECSQRPFQCPEPDCIKSFNRKSDLQRHHRIHTNERPYTCHYHDCGKSFIQRSALTVHIRTHTGEKPHKCEYLGCGKCFSDSSSLARHRRIHTGKRPYRCPIDGCEKSFCRKTTLTKHARRQHQLLDNEGADSEMETEEDLDMTSTPRKSLPARNQQKKAVRRLQQQHQRRQSALLPQGTTLFRQNTYGIHEPLSPHSPMTLPSSNSSSRNASFSSGFYNDNQHQNMMPPTPQSPYFEDHSRSISPATVIHTPVIGHAGPFHNGLRLVLDPQSPEQLLVTAQHLQSSPGSLSSCSSVSSQSSVDYFCRAPQPSTPYQSPYVSSGSYPNPSSMQTQQHAAQFHPNMHYPTSFHVPQLQAPQVWYEVNTHQHHLISTPSRMDFGYDMPIIKQEDTSMLPTPRNSFC